MGWDQLLEAGMNDQLPAAARPVASSQYVRGRQQARGSTPARRVEFGHMGEKSRKSRSAKTWTGAGKLSVAIVGVLLLPAVSCAKKPVETNSAAANANAADPSKMSTHAFGPTVPNTTP